MPIIANFAFLGTIIGLGIGAIDAKLGFGPVKLLLLNASIFSLAYLIAQTRLRTVKLAPPIGSQAIQ
jgi:hypothetical protein